MFNVAVVTPALTEIRQDRAAAIRFGLDQGNVFGQFRVAFSLFGQLACDQFDGRQRCSQFVCCCSSDPADCC